jgi:hypothetical protein
MTGQRSVFSSELFPGPQPTIRRFKISRAIDLIDPSPNQVSRRVFKIFAELENCYPFISYPANRSSDPSV